MELHYFLKRLQEKQPGSYKRYDYSQLPETFDFSKDKLRFICPMHGEFIQKATAHMYGSVCRACSYMKREQYRHTTGYFISKSRERFGDYFDYSKTKFSGKKNNLIITCPKHGDFSIVAHMHRKLKRGCPKCSNETYLTERKKLVFDKIKKVHGNKYDYSQLVFNTVNEDVDIICPIHGLFRQRLSGHSRGEDCPKCMRDKDRLSFKDFLIKAKQKHGDYYNYDKVKWTHAKAYIQITCPQHGDFEQRASSHLEGVRCKQCFIENSRQSQNEFINNAKEIHGDRYSYEKVDYQGSKVPVEIICSIHGSFFKSPNSHVSGRSGCMKCCESKGEIEVDRFLRKYSINYIREYKMKPYPYRFDFYLPDFNIFIEFHGPQHYKPVELFGGIEAFKQGQTRDRIKKELVSSTDGNLIEIKYGTLVRNRVELELIASLRRIKRYWFYENGKVFAYNKASDVYRAFNIPKNTKVRDLESVILKMYPDTQILFQSTL